MAVFSTKNTPRDRGHSVLIKSLPFETGVAQWTSEGSHGALIHAGHLTALCQHAARLRARTEERIVQNSSYQLRIPPLLRSRIFFFTSREKIRSPQRSAGRWERELLKQRFSEITGKCPSCLVISSPRVDTKGREDNRVHVFRVWPKCANNAQV